MQGLVAFLFPLILMFGIFYLLLIRPQNKERKKLEELTSNLKKGDKIVTFSGVVGRVEIINQDKGTIVIITEGSKMLIVKEAIKGLFDEH